jgi:hypothetical protein
MRVEVVLKLILVILLLAALSLLLDLELAGLGLVLMAAVLLVGDIAQGMPESACSRNCTQGDNCACQVTAQNLNKD